MWETTGDAEVSKSRYSSYEMDRQSLQTRAVRCGRGRGRRPGGLAGVYVPPTARGSYGIKHNVLGITGYWKLHQHQPAGTPPRLQALSSPVHSYNS